MAFVEGRDHLKMTGSEYHSLIAWLKSKGHTDIEDMLMKVRLLGDKKFHLVKYMRDKCAELVPAATMAGGTIIHQEKSAHPQQLPVAREGEPAFVQQAQGSPPAMPSAPPSLPAEVAAPAAPVAVAPVSGGTLPKTSHETVAELELTIGRMEESFNFAIECMKDDMRQVKTQLAALRAVVAPQ